MAAERHNAWDDWIPGVLCKRQILALSEYITGLDPKHVDVASMDLHVADEVHVLTRGSAKPGRGTDYLLELTRLGLVRRVAPDDEGCYLLEPNQAYLARLEENIVGLKGAPLFGQATAKSTIGRLDILVRLVADGMDGYESFNCAALTTGSLYLELRPNSVPVRMRPGQRLSQLRLFLGDPQLSEVSAAEYCRALGLTAPELTVDLTKAKVGNLEASVLELRPDARGKAIDLRATENAAPSAQKPAPWEFMSLRTADDNLRISLDAGAFYLMRSYERIHVPRGLAVYCLPSHEAFGEMRIHYAGFVHPWFGLKPTETCPTGLIFEVRAHNLNLGHQERIGRLQVFRMSEDAEYGESSYSEQQLQCSRAFLDWPTDLTFRDEASGIVAPG